jgi:hypothetical protein
MKSREYVYGKLHVDVEKQLEHDGESGGIDKWKEARPKIGGLQSKESDVGLRLVSSCPKHASSPSCHRQRPGM